MIALLHSLLRNCEQRMYRGWKRSMHSFDIKLSNMHRFELLMHILCIVLSVIVIVDDEIHDIIGISAIGDDLDVEITTTGIQCTQDKV